MNYITQYPTQPNAWLYKEEDGVRLFSDYVIRPIGSTPWQECTDAEKEAWEAEHEEKE